MSANKNKELNKHSSPKSPDLTSRSSGNHSYVNFDHGHTGERPSANSGTGRRSGPKTPIQPLTISNVNKLPDANKTNNLKTPKNWYSPPSSIQSESRPPNFAGYKPQFSHKEQPKLQTIDEDSVMLSVDKVIALCSHTNVEIQMNALAYLQHLIFNDNEKKLEVRNNDALRIIIELTRSEKEFVANGALGVLKNMSYTEMDMITTDIERLGGIQRMVSIIKTTKDTFQMELAIDILWNLSVHYDLKTFILSETVDTLVEFIIIPECKMMKKSGGNYVPLNEDLNWSIILRNALGIIRNISYESNEARIKLREEDGLIDCILHLILMSKGSQDAETNVDSISLIDSKIIENCVCILRNLTYAIQEIIDPTYLQSRNNPPSKPLKGKNNSKEKNILSPPSKQIPYGVDLLWNAKYIVSALFPILKFGANAITLEAAAGIIQNLSAGDWEPSKEMQIQFRLQYALPTLVELIDIAPDEVIRSAATALRNLVREDFTRNLIGTNGLRILTEKIPMSSRSKKLKIAALAAILSTIYAIIKNQDEFMKEFIFAKGVQRCIYVRDCEEFINPDDDQHPDKVVQFSKFILQLLWKTPSARDLLKKNNYKQSDITPTRNLDPCNLCTPSKPSKSHGINNDLKYHDSVDSKRSSKYKTQYNCDSGFARDSCSTMVSNAGLQQRNSKAYKTSNVPGYGQVKVSANYKPNNHDIQPTSNKYLSKASSRDESERYNQNNPYIFNEQSNNPRIHGSNTQYKDKSQFPRESRIAGSDYSYSNKSYLGQDDMPDHELNNRTNNRNLNNRPPPKISYKKQFPTSNNPEYFNHEYSKPTRPSQTSNVKDTSSKGDSWV